MASTTFMPRKESEILMTTSKRNTQARRAAVAKALGDKNYLLKADRQRLLKKFGCGPSTLRKDVAKLRNERTGEQIPAKPAPQSELPLASQQAAVPAAEVTATVPNGALPRAHVESVFEQHTQTLITARDQVANEIIDVEGQIAVLTTRLGELGASLRERELELQHNKQLHDELLPEKKSGAEADPSLLLAAQASQAEQSRSQSAH